MDIELIAQNVRPLLPEALKKKLPETVAVVLIDAKTSARLNLIYREKRKSTNVLSFYYDATYGELLICAAVVKAEAKAEGNSYEYQMTWMIVHGMLHLAGLHHEKSEAMEEKAERIESVILKKLVKPSEERLVIRGKK